MSNTESYPANPAAVTWHDDELWFDEEYANLPGEGPDGDEVTLKYRRAYVEGLDKDINSASIAWRGADTSFDAHSAYLSGETEDGMEVKQVFNLSHMENSEGEVVWEA